LYVPVKLPDPATGVAGVSWLPLIVAVKLVVAGELSSSLSQAEKDKNADNNKILPATLFINRFVIGFCLNVSLSGDTNDKYGS
jgi:hypothetical protein